MDIVHGRETIHLPVDMLSPRPPPCMFGLVLLSPSVPAIAPTRVVPPPAFPATAPIRVELVAAQINGQCPDVVHRSEDWAIPYTRRSGLSQA